MSTEWNGSAALRERFTDLTGKVCIITGASRGIGRECALSLARLGCRIVVVLSSSQLRRRGVLCACTMKCHVHSRHVSTHRNRKSQIQNATCDMRHATGDRRTASQNPKPKRNCKTQNAGCSIIDIDRLHAPYSCFLLLILIIYSIFYKLHV